MTPRLLLTGFEPFGNWRVNPSWDALVLAQSQGLFAGTEVHLARLPVTWNGAYSAFEDAVRRCTPHAAVSFGLHGGMAGREAATVYIERIARNRDGATKPDNDGRQGGQGAILAHAPETLSSTLPLEPMRNALRDAGRQAEYSDDAGGYLCNHLFFRGAAALQGRIPYGFVHVPPVEGMGGSLSLLQLAQAMAQLAAVVAESVAAAGHGAAAPERKPTR
ncbi:MAG: hypothetical protein IT463_01775 [Planctomycetes bacterium]|nr:hypothetical protein [Planctomycetota bacterium]